VRGDVEWIRGDVREDAVVARAVSGAEVVFHHAAVPSALRSVAQPVYTNTVNLDATLRVLEASRDLRRVGVLLRKCGRAPEGGVDGGGPPDAVRAAEVHR
jgi:nucleoside-diphosphate-sugar epimerase